jgi:hypothetical protein
VEPAIPQLYGPIAEEIQPGDLYSQVPFVFPTTEWEVLREQPPDSGSWSVYAEGDLPGGGPKPNEFVKVRRRMSYAMVHPQFPPCHIDKVIPPRDRRQPYFSEDLVMTMFHCVERSEIPVLWDEKLKHPENHRRIGLLGDVLLPNGKFVSLAVNWRRSQQIYGKHLARSSRIATAVSEEHFDGLTAILGLYLQYLSEGQDETG